MVRVHWDTLTSICVSVWKPVSYAKLLAVFAKASITINVAHRDRCLFLNPKHYNLAHYLSHIVCATDMNDTSKLQFVGE